MAENSIKSGVPAYKSAARLALVIQILLVITSLTSMLTLFFDFGGLIASLPSSVQKPDSQSLLKDAQLVIESLEFCEAIVFLSCGVCFLIWACRLRRNLQYFGITDLHTKAWHCTWGFVIPFLAIVLPYRSLQEIGRASSVTDVNDHWQNHKGSPLISWWWGFWLFMNGTARISERIKTVDAQGNVDVRAFTSYFVASGVNESLTVIAAILAIFVVRKLTSKQELMYKNLPAQSPISE